MHILYLWIWRDPLYHDFNTMKIALEIEYIIIVQFKKEKKG